MTPKTLRFRAVGTGMVPNYGRWAAGTMSYVGRKKVDLPPEQQTTEAAFAFPHTNEVDEVAYDQEYLKDVRNGHLEPADEATAKAMGVEWKAPNALKQIPTDNKPGDHAPEKKV